MKKVILLLAIASVVFASCGNVESSTPAVDTTVKVSATVDTANHVDSVKAKSTDTVNKAK